MQSPSFPARVFRARKRFVLMISGVSALVAAPVAAGISDAERNAAPLAPVLPFSMRPAASPAQKEAQPDPTPTPEAVEDIFVAPVRSAKTNAQNTPEPDKQDAEIPALSLSPTTAPVPLEPVTPSESGYEEIEVIKDAPDPAKDDLLIDKAMEALAPVLPWSMTRDLGRVPAPAPEPVVVVPAVDEDTPFIAVTITPAPPIQSVANVASKAQPPAPTFSPDPAPAQPSPTLWDASPSSAIPEGVYVAEVVPPVAPANAVATPRITVTLPPGLTAQPPSAPTLEPTVTATPTAPVTQAPTPPPLPTIKPATPAAPTAAPSVRLSPTPSTPGQPAAAPAEVLRVYFAPAATLLRTREQDALRNLLSTRVDQTLYVHVHAPSDPLTQALRQDAIRKLCSAYGLRGESLRFRLSPLDSAEAKLGRALSPHYAEFQLGD